MRYFRTKDGKIYDTEVNGAWETTSGTIGILTICGVVVTPKEFITKQDDTIEELCDCFVAVRPQPKGNDYYILHRFGFVKENCLNGNEVVYGGIWTDKGLQFVAKMNEKGELELL